MSRLTRGSREGLCAGNATPDRQQSASKASILGRTTQALEEFATRWLHPCLRRPPPQQALSPLGVDAIAVAAVAAAADAAVAVALVVEHCAEGATPPG
mmetsp:Transcript_60885/g.135659  ORF Transcript_60885/g.135659 Transcript_60885/m.135659 type:complete len:98 (-) Transcript_60885:253-546(-)